MHRIIRGGILSTCFLLLGSASPQATCQNQVLKIESPWKINHSNESIKQSQPQEHDVLFLEVNSGWKQGYYDEVSGQYSIREFIREDENIDNWRELLTIQNFASKDWGTPRDAFNAMQSIRERECPGSTKWNILEENESSILYESQSQDCLGWAAHHEIAKIIDGKYNRFRVAYTIKMYQMPSDRRSDWINYLSKVEVR